MKWMVSVTAILSTGLQEAAWRKNGRESQLLRGSDHFLYRRMRVILENSAIAAVVAVASTAGHQRAHVQNHDDTHTTTTTCFDQARRKQCGENIANGFHPKLEVRLCVSRALVNYEHRQDRTTRDV